MSEIDDILEHYGVRGMKWGVRRFQNRNDGPAEATRSPKNPSKIVTSKGKKIPASDDAVNAAKSLRVAKKSGTSALSNDELKTLVTRMNLEQQYRDLNSKANPDAWARMEKGSKKAKTLRNASTPAQEIYNFAKSPAGLAVGAMLSKYIYGGVKKAKTAS